MPNPHPPHFSHGSRVITLSAIPESAQCPINAPDTSLIEVIQVSGPVQMNGHANAVHVMFVYETESEIEEHHAIVSMDWYRAQFPLRLLATIPDDLDGIDSTVAMNEGPVEPDQKPGTDEPTS